MKLYDIPRGSIIKGVEIRNRQYDGELLGDTLVFNSLDGMYSHCHVEGKPEVVIHLPANTPLKKVDDHYEIED